MNFKTTASVFENTFTGNFTLSLSRIGYILIGDNSLIGYIVIGYNILIGYILIGENGTAKIVLSSWESHGVRASLSSSVFDKSLDIYP